MAAYVTVHPRVCGELRVEIGPRRLATGSSPRVRGTPARLIAPCRSFAVHPRVCGELPNTTARPTACAGSSPRVRGTQEFPIGDGLEQRFIPACAGNSYWSSSIASRFTGSSPRVRGTPGRQGDRRRGRRFIPACAGNSDKKTARRIRRFRFIPACAGNSADPLFWLFLLVVHPRVCGELWPSQPYCCSAVGSSPRVRGTQWATACPRSRSRFIPACAGNSPHSCADRSKTPVHPRVCGELICRPAPLIASSGSSPRVRGTPVNRS